MYVSTHIQNDHQGVTNRDGMATIAAVTVVLHEWLLTCALEGGAGHHTLFHLADTMAIDA